MKPGRGIILFGVTEIVIGLSAFIFLVLSIFTGRCAKPPSVIVFVLAAALISFLLGAGILRRSLISYRMLQYFATVIILSKLLIFAGVISLSGALDTSMPQPAKNIISLVYHSFLLFYFNLPAARKYFGERRG